MNNSEFWESINNIVENGFNDNGLNKLDEYADKFNERKLLYKRFSPKEQYGCSAGGTTHVIATLLAGRKDSADTIIPEIGDFKRELQQAEKQAETITAWAKKTGLWIPDINNFLKHTFGDKIAEGGEATIFDNGTSLIKAIGLDYFIQPIYALDRISLHNAIFPETKLTVIGFGADLNNEFKIVASQPFIKGVQPSVYVIRRYLEKLGFELINPTNWTYSNSSIYLSDVHDENVIKGHDGSMFVIDCDIRINIPSLKANGNRILFSNVEIS